jgi:hypothetical protein
VAGDRHEGGHAVTHDGFQSDEARDRAVGRSQEENALGGHRRQQRVGSTATTRASAIHASDGTIGR